VDIEAAHIKINNNKGYRKAHTLHFAYYNAFFVPWQSL
jgi:hypothetical protein